MADDKVYIRADLLGGEAVAHGVHVAVEVEHTDKLRVVGRGVPTEVDDVGVVEVFGQLVEAGGVSVADLGLAGAGLVEDLAGHGYQKELGVGSDGLVLLDHAGVVAGEGPFVLRGIGVVDIGHLT